MPHYTVTFQYTVVVEATDEQHAATIAADQPPTVPPLTQVHQISERIAHDLEHVHPRWKAHPDANT